MGRQLELEITKKGWPCLWEKGGAKKNIGTATIVCDYDGYPKYPLVVKIKGNLACANHALIPISLFDTVVEVTIQHQETEVEILRIMEINKKQKTAEVTRIAHYKDGKWDDEKLHMKYKDACDKALEKAHCFHCREPHFADLSKHRFH